MASDARYKEGCEALAKTLAEYADVFGPTSCPIHGQDKEACECDPAIGKAISTAMLGDWVVMTCWTDMETGDSFVDYRANPGALYTHTLGLVTYVVEKMDEDDSR